MLQALLKSLVATEDSLPISLRLNSSLHTPCQGSVTTHHEEALVQLLMFHSGPLLRLNGVREFYLSVYGNRLRL